MMCRSPSSALGRLSLNINEAYAFAAERSEGHHEPVIKKGRGELKLADVIRDARDDAMSVRHSLQQALEKEWSTWCKYDAVAVIPTNDAKKVSADVQITSSAVWANKGTNMTTDFQPKCRIVGRGFQEKCDEKLRRDSPTCTPLMVHILYSIAASHKMTLYAADARGASLQGNRIERELYFKLPSNIAPCKLPRSLSPGCLRLNKSTHGTNDAARAWYLAL